MIMKCSIDGTTNITLTTGLKPNISNNGTKIAFMNQNNLFTMDINGSNIKRLTNYYDPSGVYLENFSWSQDDSGILFDYNDISDYKYHISKIENNSTTELYSSVEDSLLYINNMKWSIKNKKDNKQTFLNNIAW
jgi:Tol biopolymer transport system component